MSTTFLNKTLNIKDLNRFNAEVKALSSKIEVVLKFGEDDLRISLNEGFTAQEHTDLDAFIAAFIDSDPEDKIPLIYDIVKNEARHKHHHNIDYIKDVESGRNLIPKRTVTKGEVTKVEWFKTLDAEQNPTDLVLKVDISYTRDATGFALYRTTVRTWMNRDGSENLDKKYTSKFYFVNPSDMITEGYNRRKLLVQSIQIPVMQMMLEVLSPPYSETAVVLKGRAFLDDYETLFSKFIENSSTVTNPADPNMGKKNVIVALEDSSVDGINKDYNEWLDLAPPMIGGLTTIRQYLINEFDI